MSPVPWWGELSDDDLYAALVAADMTGRAAAGLVWHRFRVAERLALAGVLGWEDKP